MESAGYVWVMQGSLAVLGFRRDDPATRNIVIATLLEARVKGVRIAEALGVSEALVSNVKKKLAEGGLRAAAEVRTGGRRRAFDDETLERVRALRARGATHQEIADRMGVSRWTVSNALQGMPAGQLGQPRRSARKPRQSTKSQAPQGESEDPEEVEQDNDELAPCAPLPAGPAEHPSRYAGTVLLCAMVQLLAVPQALAQAGAQRSVRWGYSACEVLYALICGWAAGYHSLESMHERDARGLGVVLGLQRSPSVRTLHRAIHQMTQCLSPLVLGGALLRGAASAVDSSEVYGIDGHFKRYSGKEPVDKGWNSKARLVTKGLQDVYVTDELGRMLFRKPVGAGDALSSHVLDVARALHASRVDEARTVVAFDRGGFAFDVLDRLDEEGFGYITYVPAKVKMPDLGSVAPEDDGIGAVEWEHGSLHHAARLLVRRDGAHLIPMVTNFLDLAPELVVQQLRSARAMQENGFKAARAFVAIDALNDRGGATRAPDDRPVPNPVRAKLKAQQTELEERMKRLEEERPARGQRTPTDIATDLMVADFQQAVLDKQLPLARPKVAATDLDPGAERAWLRTRNRALLLPLKLAADNARRLLLDHLGAALSPSDAEYDESSRTRTLLSLLRAPGTLRFTEHEVFVTLDLPLPPTPHARLAPALEQLDGHDLRFTDGRRRLRIRLAPRPTRSALPHKLAATQTA